MIIMCHIFLNLPDFLRKWLLKNSDETIGDSLLIAMVLKGLPLSFNSFKTVVTQKDKHPTFQQLKVSLRAYEESEHSNAKTEK